MSKDELKEQIESLWVEYSNDLNKSFDFQQRFQPTKIQISDVPSTSENMGGYINGETLYISKSVFDGEIPLHAITAMMCYQTAFPEGGVCDECIEDMAIEYGRQQLEGDSQTKWAARWQKYQEQRDGDSYRGHFSYWFLPALSTIRNLDVHVTLSKEFAMMARSNITFDLNDYHIFLSTRRAKFAKQLTKTELKLIDKICHYGTENLSKLSVDVGVSPQWISRKISELRKNSVLRYYNQIPFSKIGIRMFLLFMGTSNQNMGPIDYVRPCPFLYGFKRIIAGKYHSLATITIPDNETNIQAMNHGLALISKQGVSTSMIEIKSSGMNTCYDHYDVRIGKWNIPWDLRRIELEKIHAEGIASLFPRIDSAAKLTNLTLDSIDIQILGCVRRRIDSVTNIRKELKIGQHKVASHLKRLRDGGLIVPLWEARQIGLNESVVVSTSDTNTGESIAAWAQRLPKSIISFDTDKQLLLQTDLPQGGGYGLSSALGAIDQDISISFVEQRVIGNFNNPLDLWDVDKQKWASPTQKIQEWLSGLQ